MKKIFFLLILLPFASYSQKKTDSVVFKDATKIIIKTDLSPEENYKSLINKLLDDGFVIAAKDDTFLTVKTEERSIPKSTFKYLLNVRVKDNEIVFSGQYRTGVEIMVMGTSSGKDEFTDIIYKPSARNKLTFKSMENAAKLFPMPLIYSN